MLTRRELLIVLLRGLLAGQRPQSPHGGGEAPRSQERRSGGILWRSTGAVKSMECDARRRG